MVIFSGNESMEKQGLGANPQAPAEGDDEFDTYRKRMMMAYRFRPNPLVGFFWDLWDYGIFQEVFSFSFLPVFLRFRH